jgi:hypothetical protein
MPPTKPISAACARSLSARLRSCGNTGCSVSGIALLSVVLESCRRVAGYDPTDVVVAAGRVPAGARFVPGACRWL